MDWLPRYPHRAGHGFVLLWSLALLVLAAVVLSVVTLQSSRTAARAVEAQDRLQVKWALASARAVLLPQAEAILQAAKPPTGPAPSVVLLQQPLGDVVLEAQVTDEQAKVNLNSIYQQVGLQRTTSVVKELVGNGHVQSLLNPDARSPRPEVHRSLSPATRPLAATRPSGFLAPRPFGCWDQVLVADDPARLLAGASPSPIGNLTLWGNGKLNLRRASDRALRSWLGATLPLTTANRIVGARVRSPEGTMQQWLAAAEVAKEQQAALMPLVTGSSSCHGLILHVRSPQRNWYEMAIQDGPEVAGQDELAATTQAVGPATRPGGGELADSQAVRIYRLQW